MTSSQLTWQITWRSALRLFGLGALFGGIYGPSVVNVLLLIDVVQRSTSITFDMPLQFLGVMLFAAAVGAFIGAPLGFIVGILVGLLISAITVRAFVPLYDVPRYMQVVRRSSTTVGGIVTLVGSPLASLVLFGSSAFKPIGMLVLFSVVPALLACVAIWRGSGWIAAWYVRASGHRTNGFGRG
jgi:hypothetical protein